MEINHDFNKRAIELFGDTTEWRKESLETLLESINVDDHHKAYKIMQEESSLRCNALLSLSSDSMLAHLYRHFAERDFLYNIHYNKFFGRDDGEYDAYEYGRIGKKEVRELAAKYAASDSVNNQQKLKEALKTLESVNRSEPKLG